MGSTSIKRSLSDDSSSDNGIMHIIQCMQAYNLL